MESRNSAKFSSDRHYGSEDKFKWLKSKISHTHLNLPLLFISKARGMKTQGISS